MTKSRTLRVDRRTTLGWLGVAIGVSVSGVPLPLGNRAYAAAGNEAGAGQSAPMGYGNDPNLLDPHAPWPRTMTEAQLQLVAILADIILPKTGSHPAPSEVGIPDFVDEWISAPYPDQQRDRALILAGLAWLDSEAHNRWQSEFSALDLPRKTQLFEQTTKIPTNGGPQAMELYGFFRRLRSVTVGAYYSMKQNFAEIGYIGNVPMMTFPPPTPEEDAFIDRAIAKLNLQSG